MTPPPLSWLPSYANSIGAALGCSVSYSIEETINPLIKKVVLEFGEVQTGKTKLHVWNLFQKYAHSNECLPHGKTDVGNPKRLAVSVIIKRRFGPPIDSPPWDKEPGKSH